jgi:general secretion pathway protein I
MRTEGTRAEGGFTLIEVLVALTIVAVALAAAMRGAMTLTNGSRDINARVLATMSAENELAQITLAGVLPSSDATYDCPEGGLSFQCRRRVKLTPNPNLRWITLDVSLVDDPEHRLATQMMLMRIH